MRFVFSSESVKVVQLGNGGPPGRFGGETGWRAVTRVLRSCSEAMEWVVADVTNVFLPSDCRVCGAAMATLNGVRICEACVGHLGPAVGEEPDVLCSRCGDALGMESARFQASIGMSECTMCRMAQPQFDRAVAFANYDNEMREMLHLLKFDGLRGVAGILGDGMAETIRKFRGAAAGELMVIPVPLFEARERMRGFNQSKLLADAAVRKLRRLEPGWKLRVSVGVLKRVKDTPALYELNPAQRRRNLVGAFRVDHSEAVRGREVLLIDDIMTTGATARACSGVLKRAGAAKVWVVTAAKAQPESVQSAVRHEAGGFAIWDAGGPPVSAIAPKTELQQRFD